MELNHPSPKASALQALPLPLRYNDTFLKFFSTQLTQELSSIIFNKIIAVMEI